jgi:hypothetical protein
MFTFSVNSNNDFFYCKNCHYKSCKKQHFDRHLLTAKHKKSENVYKKGEKGEYVEKSYVCNCGKQYKYRQSLYTHKKKCQTEQNIQSVVIENTENKNLENLVVHLINENTEIKEIVKKQQEQLLELIPKVSNTTNNTINNNKFNINVFLNEKCKDALSINEFIQQIEISLKNLLTTREKGLGIGLSEIINENINKLSVYERPIHCTDKKRETLYIKNESWEKDKDREKTKDMLKALQSQQFKYINEWVNNNPNYNKDENLKLEYMTLINKCSSSLNECEKKIFKNICDSTYLKENEII